MAANYFLLQTVTKEQTCRKFCNFPGRNFFSGFFAETIFLFVQKLLEFLCFRQISGKKLLQFSSSNLNYEKELNFLFSPAAKRTTNHSHSFNTLLADSQLKLINIKLKFNFALLPLKLWSRLFRRISWSDRFKDGFMEEIYLTNVIR